MPWPCASHLPYKAIAMAMLLFLHQCLAEMEFGQSLGLCLFSCVVAYHKATTLSQPMNSIKLAGTRFFAISAPTIINLLLDHLYSFFFLSFDLRELILLFGAAANFLAQTIPVIQSPLLLSFFLDIKLEINKPFQAINPASSIYFVVYIVTRKAKHMRPGSHSLLPSSRRASQKLRLLASPTAASGAINALKAAKMKALISLCIGITIFLTFHRHQRPMASLSPASAPPPGKGYTILINTWKRNDLLQKSVSHYSKCTRVDSIHIVWSEPDPPTDLLYKVLRDAVHSNSNRGNNIELIFDLNQEDSLNNRFKEMKNLKSDAIFSIDDDVIFPCKSVDFAFNVWRSAPETMVGFVPRMHWSDNSNSSADQYFYGGWWSVWWTGTYSMVLSKAAFFHKKYLHSYSTNMSESIRNYATKNRNCEDIAMAFLIANATGAPPIWVKGRIFEMGSNGISSLGSHEERRTQCLNDFAAIYGHMPLVATNVKAIDSRSSWLW